MQQCRGTQNSDNDSSKSDNVDKNEQTDARAKRMLLLAGDFAVAIVVDCNSFQHVWFPSSLPHLHSHHTHTHTHLFHFIIVNVHTSVCKIVNISVDYEFSIPTFPPQRKRLMHTYMPHVSLICALKTQSLNSQLSHFILFVSLIFHIVPRI